MVSTGIFPSGLSSQLDPGMIFLLASSIHRKGSISHFWIEIFIFPTLKHPTISVSLRSHPAVQLELDVPFASPSSQSSYPSISQSPQYHRIGSSIIIFSVSQMMSLVEQVTVAFSGVVSSS